ncbi:MAG: amidase [Pseudomonadota bacterium]
MSEDRPLWTRSACDVVTMLQNNQVTTEMLLADIGERLQDVDSAINALPTLCLDRMPEFGDDDDGAETSLLHGLPVAVKDLTEVKGVRTTYGCSLYADHVPEKSDKLVRRIERRGGVVFAKSNTPEFGTGGITFNDVFGVTRSPRNLDFSAGGSSGGAAAALASGCAWLSHGSDMAGSLRTPAAFCGVTSLRPSPGSISSDALDLPFSVLGQQGPMARSIEDLALFADVLFDDPGQGFRSCAQESLMPARIAFSLDLGITEVNADVEIEFSKVVQRLQQQGIRMCDGAPDLTDVHDSFDILRAHEYAISFETLLEQNPGVMKPEVEWNVQCGLSLSSAELRGAEKTRGRIVDSAGRFMEGVDCLICPATSVSAVDATLRYPGSAQLGESPNSATVPICDYYRWLGIAYATTMMSLPVITLPCGRFDSGMPFAIQLVGKPHGEAELFRIAAAIERLFKWTSTPV